MRRFTKGKWHTHIHDEGKENTDVWVSMSAGQKINASCHRYRLLCNCQHNQYWQQYQHDPLCLCHVLHHQIVPCVLQCIDWCRSYDRWCPCSPYPSIIERERKRSVHPYFSSVKRRHLTVTLAKLGPPVELICPMIWSDEVFFDSATWSISCLKPCNSNVLLEKTARSLENVAGSPTSYIPFW